MATDERLKRFGVKRFKDLAGMKVRLRRQITTKGGDLYAAGTEMQIGGSHRGRIRLDVPGTINTLIRQVSLHDIEPVK